MNCEICGGVLRRHRHEWLRKCSGCGVLSASLPLVIPNRPTEGKLDEEARTVGLDVLRRENNAVLISALVNDKDLPGRRVLDVGCGPGFLLQQARDAGLEPYGIEPDANVLQAARRGGAPVRHGYFPAVLGEDERFDAIVFNDVLEHIPALMSAVTAAHQHLNPGGLLVINCPNREGLFYKVASALDRLGINGPYDRLWQKGLPSPHVWYFTPRDLDRAVTQAGFDRAGTLRLQTVKLRGLWSRIRMVKETPMQTAVATVAFTVAMYPIMRLFPSDAGALFYRRRDG